MLHSILHTALFQQKLLAMTLCALLAFGLSAAMVQAQSNPAASKPQGYVEAGFLHQTLTAGFPALNSVYVQGTRQQGAYEVWRFEGVFQQAFGDQGFLYNVQTTRGLGTRWFGRANLGFSSGGFFLPRFSASAQIARKWLPSQQLITVFGASVYDAKDVHRDYAVTAEAQYYFSPSWVAQGSFRYNISTPGAAHSRYYFLALTYGKPKKHYFTLRYAFGNEAYTLVEPFTFYNNFGSRDLMLTWRQWLHKDWGFNLNLMHYQNPFYERGGFQVGIFKHY